MRCLMVLSCVCCVTMAFAEEAARTKLVLIAGMPSHPVGMHEFNAGAQILRDSLRSVANFDVVLQLNGYPSDEAIFNDAAAIVCYADGGPRHPLVQGDRLKTIDKLIDQGVGLMCMHYGVEVEAPTAGAEFQKWIGGHYEKDFSCNPMWKPEFHTFPEHPIARGVKPFAVEDEWYFNMRFRPEMTGITPILVAAPSAEVRNGPYVYPKGPYKHIQEAMGRSEIMMWASERTEGGRGVGFTGGHFHANWKDENFRKVVLNAMLWVSGREVPENGVESTVNDAQMTWNLDPKWKKNKPK